MKYLQLEPTLMPHQVEFVFDDTTPMQAFVGGYRAGKSEALVWKSLRCAAELYPGKQGLIMAPIAGMNQPNIVPILRRILPQTGLKYNTDQLSNQFVRYLDIYVGDKTSRIWLDVSAENSGRLVGRTLAWGAFDEADMCRNAELAETAFQQLLNRLSDGNDGKAGLAFAVSTPEGFGMMHKRFVEQASEDTRIWHVDMRENYLLPKGYVENQLKTIPANRQDAYIRGLFVNIFTSLVYDFDRVKNASTVTLGSIPKHANLHIGEDFNIDNNAAVVHWIDEHGHPHAIAEHTGIKSVPDMIQIFHTQYRNKGFQLFIYPDASGQNRNATGSTTAMALLRQAGFRVIVNPSNPGVGDRINSMNAMFSNAQGQHRYKVNINACPVYVRSLERQAWKTSQSDKSKKEPDKSNNIDHPLDAAGYFIHKTYPLVGKPTLRTTS